MISFDPFESIHGGFLGKNRDADELPFALVDLVQLEQVHGNEIVLIKAAEDRPSAKGKAGDALLTNLPDIPLAVRSADCVPVLLAHPAGVVGAVHAGWRGTLAGVVPKTLITMQQEFGVELRECRVAVGPAICQNCFEVGEDVAGEFRPRLKDGSALRVRGNKFLLDLRKANLEQIFALGIPSENVEQRGECTRCLEKKFYSYRGATSRGEKNDGRNISWIIRSHPR